jgi:hypothetical protein
MASQFENERRRQLAENAQAAQAKNDEALRVARARRPDAIDKSNDRFFFPRAREELDTLLPRAADSMRNIVRPGATAGERGAAVADSLGQFTTPIMGAAGDIASGVFKRTLAPAARAVGGFFNPAAATLTGGEGLDVSGTRNAADVQTQNGSGGAEIPPEVVDAATPAPFEPPAPDLPPHLSNAVGNTFTAGGGGSGQSIARPPSGGTFDPVRGFESGVPDDAIEVIRGTQRSFQEVDPETGSTRGLPEIRPVPGRTFAEARELAALRDPAEQFRIGAVQEASRINNDTLRAESDRLRATEPFGGVNPDGTIELFTRGTDGVPRGLGISPVVDSIVNGNQEFTVETVSVPGAAGLPMERQIRLNKRDGTFLDITEKIREEIAVAEFNKRIQQDPGADPFDILEEIEEQTGGAVPLLRQALSPDEEQ